MAAKGFLNVGGFRLRLASSGLWTDIKDLVGHLIH